MCTSVATKSHGGCMSSIWTMIGIYRLYLWPFLGASKKIERPFLIFLATICITQFPAPIPISGPSNSRYCVSGRRKLRPKKSKTTKLVNFSLIFTNTYPNQMTKPISLIRRDKAARLIVHTWVFKLLNQAAPPIRQGDLPCRRTFRHTKFNLKLHRNEF